MHEDIQYVRRRLNTIADEIDCAEIYLEKNCEHGTALLNVINQLAEIRIRMDAVRTDCLKLQPKEEN